MHHVHSILLLSNDSDTISQVEQALADSPDYRLTIANNETEGYALLRDIHCDLFLCDMEAVKNSKKNIAFDMRVRIPHMGRVILAQQEHAKNAAKFCRQSAAFLYLLAPYCPLQLQLMIKRCLENSELSRRHRLLSRELKMSIDDQIFGLDDGQSAPKPWSSFEKLVYASANMDELCTQAKQAAVTELPILVHGETGTGKELLARAIHYNSKRKNAPLMVQNCGGISDEILHSEIFGHMRGAYTGAVANRLGLFRAADGGTVFLDEISEISPSFQVSLLRFLQEGEVKPLGSDHIEHSDVRIIAASNRNLEDMVEKGEFRRDLYYRLRGFELNIPPLRDRKEDITILATYFANQSAEMTGKRILGIAHDALEKLQAHHYPGNVRELEMEIRRATALAASNGYIHSKYLSDRFSSLTVPQPHIQQFSAEGDSLKDKVEALEKHVVLDSLSRHHWNQSKAAEELGLSRVGIANKIKRYELKEA